MLRATFFGFVLLVAGTNTARAESAPGDAASPLALDEVLSSVDRNFPLILAAAREQDEARGAMLAAEGGFDPSLRATGAAEPVGGYPKQYLTVQVDQPTPLWGAGLFAAYRYGSGKIPIYDGKLETNDLGEVRGGVRVPVWRDGPIDRRRASIRQAELGVAIGKLGVDQQRIEFRRLAALRYWDWVAAGQSLTILRDWLALASARDAGLATRAKGGDIPEIDRTENERTILQRRASVVGAERDLAQAAVELSLYLRTSSGASLTPPPARLPKGLSAAEPPEVAGARVEEERALERRPDLKRLDLVRDRARIEAELARNQQKPAVDISMYGARQFGPGDATRGEPVLGGAIVLDIPILNRVQTGREQSAEATVAKTDEQSRFLRDRIVADVRNALLTLDASRQRAELAKKEVIVARQLAEAELRKFELGEGNLLLVNLREQATAEAALREVVALADFQRALASFRAATARDLSK